MWLVRNLVLESVAGWLTGRDIRCSRVTNPNWCLGVFYVLSARYVDGGWGTTCVRVQMLGQVSREVKQQPLTGWCWTGLDWNGGARVCVCRVWRLRTLFFYSSPGFYKWMDGSSNRIESNRKESNDGAVRVYSST